MELKGIDVSRWQGNIDWNKVKASGISFAFIKSSQGGFTNMTDIDPFKDPLFEQNIVNASSAGIKCGIYHYMTGTTETDVIKEADYLINLLEPYRDCIKFPVAIDIEHARYKSLSVDVITALLRIFVDKIDAAGYIPVLYSYRSFLNSRINIKELSDVDVWCALWYTPRTDSPQPVGFENMTAWQWSDQGKVDGIPGWVDLDVGYKDYSAPFQKGDINGDGKLDAKDYLLLKRIVLGTYIPTEEESLRAAAIDDSGITSKAYLKLKREILGTYKLK